MEAAPEHDNTTTDVEPTQTEDAETATNPMNTSTTSTQETINPKTKPTTDSENAGAAHMTKIAKPEENHNSEATSRTEPTNATIESANMDVVDENDTSTMQNWQSTSHQALAIKEPLQPRQKKHCS